MKNNIVIAIDGPAGSGKSTIARLAAKKLGILYIDSGAIYRAITLLFLKENVNNYEETKALLEKAKMQFKTGNNGVLVFLNGKDVTQEIRSKQVTANVSAVSEEPKVREVVTGKLRELAKDKAVVIDGRDIGTAVFPEADLKIYLEASLEERAKRRCEELKSSGAASSFDEIKRDIARRDKHDSERRLSPLKQANDAIVLDTTSLSIGEGVNFITKRFENLEC